MARDRDVVSAAQQSQISPEELAALSGLSGAAPETEELRLPAMVVRTRTARRRELRARRRRTALSALVLLLGSGVILSVLWQAWLRWSAR